MAALTAEQKARALEFQTDFCALESEDFDSPYFTQWFNAYKNYVDYGPADERGGDRPPVKPPRP